MTPDELARIAAATRDQVVADMRAIAALFDEGSDTEPTDDDLERFEALQTRLDELDAEQAESERRAERIAAARQSVQVMQRAVRTDPAVRPASSDLMAAYDNFLRTGVPNADIAELRDTSVPGIRNAMGEGTGSAGGYTVPDEFALRMTERMVAFGGVIRVAERITTSDGRNITWPDLDDTANEGEIVAEGAAAASGADLSFTKHELGAYRFDSVGTGGNPLRVSRELLDDSMFDIQGMIERALPVRIMRHASTKFVLGTGANEPQGLLYGLTGIELEADTNGVTYDDLINFEHSVDPAYREMGGCVWVMNDASWKTIKKIKDSNGDPVWTNPQGGIVIGETKANFVLNGYPVIVDQACPDIDVDNNTQNWGAFGDITEGFVIRMVGGPALLVDPYTRISQNEIQFVANQRMDSIRNNDAAYNALTGEQ